jgi:GNAT acetyltransferase-like protein
MTRNSEVELRLARPEDVERIALLLPELAGPHYSERFPDSTGAAFCQWKYFNNPAGEAAVGIALSGDRVVSIAAAAPKLIQVEAELFTTFELGDFITATDYRNRGLFSKLVELISTEAVRRTAAFAYVRPNSLSFPILAKHLSFVEVRRIDLRRYVVPSALFHRKIATPTGLLRALGIDRAALRLLAHSSSRSITVCRTTRFDTKMDEFWERIRLRYRFSLVRDSRYLNWRYVDCPTPYLLWIAYRGPEVAGYLVGFVGDCEGIGNLVDLFTDPEDTEASVALVREGLEAMLGAGAESVYTWTLQSGAESAGTRALGHACPLKSRDHLHLAMRFRGGSLDESRLPPRGWQVAMGDFDGI